MFKFRRTVDYTMSYLPTKRCRKPRQADMEKTTDFHIVEISSKEAPVAFEVTQYDGMYPSQTCYPTLPIRLYKGKLYKETVDRYYYHDENDNEHEAFRLLNLNDGSLQDCLNCKDKYDTSSSNFYYPDGYNGSLKAVIWSLYDEKKPFTDESVEVDSDFAQRKEAMQKHFDSKVIIDGRLYEQTLEPRYCYEGFGLGHNYGGTGFFIEYSYNENISKSQYFRADEFSLAYEKAIDFAKRRGDTESVEDMKADRKSKKTYIKVLIPQAISINPQEEAKEEKAKNNLNEDIIQASSDALTAGLLIMGNMAKKD